MANQFTKTDPKVAIFFADGLNLNGENFIKAVGETLPSTVIIGGLAGSSGSFKTTLVFDNKNIFKHGAVGIGLYGESIIAITDYKCNWSTIGKAMKITKSNGNRIYTIDGNSAYDIYRYYLGDDVAMHLPKIGMQFPLVKEYPSLIARSVIEKYDDGSLEFTGNFKEGEVVKFGFINSDSVFADASYVSEEILNTDVESIFIYSCMARRRLMPDMIYKEIEPLSTLASTAGFFTNGSFLTHNNESLFNQTMSVIALSENVKKPIIKFKHTPQNIVSKKKLDFFSTVKALVHLVDTSHKELELKNQQLQELNEILENSIDLKIRELREKDHILIQQSKLASMGEMIGNIAHQWRQPLNVIGAINMKIETLLDFGEVIDSQKYKPISSDIVMQLDYMSKTIDDFRDFFIKRKEKSVFSIYEAIMDVYNLVKIQYQNKNIEIDIQGSDIFINGYKNEFKQVVINILNNAKDAILARYNNRTLQDDGYIKIILSGNLENIQLFIIDNGGGIPESVLPKIFEPYYTTKSKTKGTGIGLYMSHHIIHGHFHGELQVENTVFTHNNNKYKGAMFKIILPSKINSQ
ncbi:hypothetical protein FWKOB_00255 [Arcobacter sp. FWKO B]|nr:hypothetical protein FWKOB_00255 [Arcobacter sp. FWKO B]